MAKNRVSFIGLKCIDKIIVTVILQIGLWIVIMLVTPFMVFANGTDRITTSSSENIVNSGEVAKNEKNIENKLITISVRNASLKETVLGICRSYGISVIGVESLKGTVTATVTGESPEAIINELGKLYHFSVLKEHNTLLIDSDDETLEKRELYVISPEHLPAESLKNVVGTVVKNDKMAVLSEQNEVIMHLTSGEKRRVETKTSAIGSYHHCYGTILC